MEGVRECAKRAVFKKYEGEWVENVEGAMRR